MPVLSDLEAKIKTIWQDVDGEARRDLRQLLADAKAEAAKVEADVKADIASQLMPRLEQLKTEAAQALEAAGPGVQAEVTRVIEAAVADLAGLVGAGL